MKGNSNTIHLLNIAAIAIGFSLISKLFSLGLFGTIVLAAIALAFYGAC